MLAGVIHQVNAFETWNAEPRIIHSTDPAGIAYYAPSRTLFLADSEIDENVEFTGNNVFQISRDGTSVQGEFWPGNNPEPTGITWNERDGFFYVTNDDEKTITRFDEEMSEAIGSIDSRRLGVNDPEDITSDPEGLLYAVSGHPPLVSVFDSHFNLIRTFATDVEMQDAEGIAYNRENGHLYLVSAADQAIFEYTSEGNFIDRYALDLLEPPPDTPQGLAFAPCTDVAELNCLFIADGGRDNKPDGHVYEVRLGESPRPYYTARFDEEQFSFGPIPENAIPGRVVGAVAAGDQAGNDPVYGIVRGNVDGKFSINSQTGLITLANGIDYEDKSSYTLVIQAEFPDAASAMVEATITIADIVTEIALADPNSLSFQYGAAPSPDYLGTQDTKIRADFADNNYGSSNRLEFDGKPDMAAFLKWDVSQIPEDSSIQSVAITINVTNTSVDQFNLYQLFQPWAEDSATFMNFASGLPWQVPGASGPADRGVLVLGTVAGPALGTATIQLNRVGIAVVQAWVNDSSQNHGLVLRDFTDARTDDLVFSSKENADPTRRPKLTIQYSPRLKDSKAWRNPESHYDANGDSAATPSDALVIINRLNQFGVIDLSKDEENSKGSGYYPDVTGDGMITPLDALVVINYLNPAPEAESGSSVVETQGQGLEATFVYLQPFVGSCFQFSPDNRDAHELAEQSTDDQTLLPAILLGPSVPESRTTSRDDETGLSMQERTTSLQEELLDFTVNDWLRARNSSQAICSIV